MTYKKLTVSDGTLNRTHSLTHFFASTRSTLEVFSLTRYKALNYCCGYLGYCPVAYLGGAWCDAPLLWPDQENFLQATLYEKVRFLPFSSKFQKWANLRLPLNVQKQKVFQLQGGFTP